MINIVKLNVFDVVFPWYVRIKQECCFQNIRILFSRSGERGEERKRREKM